MLDWLDAHAGSVQALATFVLVALTAYYAWATRALVLQTRATLQASARMTLQTRLDHVSELSLRYPEVWNSLDAAEATGQERDGRFQLAGMFIGVLEEAYTQYALERSMTEQDWRAWEATLDALMQMRYLRGYWANVRHTFHEGFRQYVDDRLART